MVNSKTGSLTHIALITGIACLCTGVIYGFVNVPFCWHCLSAENVQRTDCEPVSWYCERCHREWMAETPWKDGITITDKWSHCHSR